MNKILFALLFASVSFGTIPTAFAGKKAQKETEDKKIVGVQKKKSLKKVEKSAEEKFIYKAGPISSDHWLFQPKRVKQTTEKVKDSQHPIQNSYRDNIWEVVKNSNKSSS